MKIKPYLLFSIGIAMLFFTACVKDTDFDQTDDILVTPVLELDFLLFTLDSESFSDIGVNNLIVSDTTNLNFLNDEFTADNLIKAEFYFKYTNSFSVDFVSEYKFLDDDNELQYEIIIPINAGSIAAPLITEHIENIEGDNLLAITNAGKVVVNVIASSPVDNLDGSLNLQSKATYYLRIE